MGGVGKEEVAAIIFGCDHVTEEECLGRNLFGLPVTFKDTILKTQQGTTVFLFNYFTRVLHGVFEAKGAGGFNLNPHAFGQMKYKDGTSGSRFPSQLNVQRVKDAGSIPEQKFKNIIKDNYYHKSKFHPFLNQQQLDEILAIFEKQYNDQNAKRSLEEAGPSDQQLKKQKTNVTRGTKIDLQLVELGEDDRTNICIKMMPAIVTPLQMVKVLSRCIPRQFDFVSLLQLSHRGVGKQGSYNFFVNCTGSDAVRRMHWWLHGNKWSDIWAAVSGQQIYNCDYIVQLEFAKTQGLKEIVTKFRSEFSIVQTDPINWQQLPSWRIWLQPYTDPAMVDEIEDHLNNLRIQLQQQQAAQKQKRKAKQERKLKQIRDQAQNKENNIDNLVVDGNQDNNNNNLVVDGNQEEAVVGDQSEEFVQLEEGDTQEREQNQLNPEQNQNVFDSNVSNCDSLENNQQSQQQQLNHLASGELTLQLDEENSAEKNEC